MKTYRFKTYSEVPEVIASYLANVAGIKYITQLSLPEINDFVADMNRWYENDFKYNSCVQ